jgi:hypothetical protein
MHRALLVLALLFAIGAAAPARAQEPPRDGTLVVTVVYSPVRDWDLAPGRCDVYVYAALKGQQMPSNLVDVADPRLPIVATSKTNPTGRALFSLPEGRYSVARGHCEHTKAFAEANFRDPYYPYQCCDYLEGRPNPDLMEDTNGVWVLTVEHITVRAGETTTAYFEEWGEDTSVSKRELWLLLGGIVLGIGVIAAFSAILHPGRPPASDAKAPKRYVPREPDKKPATFEDVFGEFKNRRSD